MTTAVLGTSKSMIRLRKSALLRSIVVFVCLLLSLTSIVIIFDQQTSSIRINEVVSRYSRLIERGLIVEGDKLDLVRIENDEQILSDNDVIIPLVLMFTDKYYANPRFNTIEYLNKLPCKFKCRYTDDKSKWNESRTVIIREQFPSGTYPQHASYDQRVLIMLPEAPGRNPVRTGLEKISKNYINLTFGYMKEFDFYKPYDAMIEQESSDEEWQRIKRTLEHKTKGACIIYSNCISDSKREIYMEVLKKFFPIETFGRCGDTRECNPDCMHRNLYDYHFYMAFENNVCEEYFTEKFYHIKDLIVPIVLKDEIYRGNVPNNSYIAIDQFDSISQLVDHLKYLMKNKTAYYEYFEWTRHYSLKKPSLWRKQYCDICENAHDLTFNKVYEDISEFFGPERLCDNDFVPRLLDLQLYNNSTLV